MKKYGLILLSLFFVFSACKNEALIKPGDPINVAYEKAMTLYENEKWGDAAEAFEIVTRTGRGTNYAQDAQFYLAESYYNNGRYLLAASEYERFASFYPQDPRRMEADFKRAMSYYHQSPRYRLDQETTRRAIRLFQLFNNNYPNSELVTESAEKIDELRNKLARKQYEAAEFYERTEMYKAATIYYNLTVDQYPESKWAERALVNLINLYNVYASKSIRDSQRERYEKAIETYEKFLQLFPRSELRSEAEAYRDEAERSLKALGPAEDATLSSN